MSNYSDYPSIEPVIITQRPKNQVTLPKKFTDLTKAKAGTKYKAKINEQGNLELEIVQNDIRKYMGLLQADKSAVALIREERSKDDASSL